MCVIILIFNKISKSSWLVPLFCPILRIIYQSTRQYVLILLLHSVGTCVCEQGQVASLASQLAKKAAYYQVHLWFITLLSYSNILPASNLPTTCSIHVYRLSEIPWLVSDLIIVVRTRASTTLCMYVRTQVYCTVNSPIQYIRSQYTRRKRQRRLRHPRQFFFPSFILELLFSSFTLFIYHRSLVFISVGTTRG